MTPPIYPQDLVMLRHTPAWTGRVEAVSPEAQEAIVMHWGERQKPCCSWIPLDLLELVPGQEEVICA